MLDQKRTMRVECEFGRCGCTMHKGIHERAKCSTCGHAACWHRLDQSQFASNRDMVRRPVYEYIYEARVQPMVPSLPLDSYRQHSVYHTYVYQ